MSGFYKPLFLMAAVLACTTCRGDEHRSFSGVYPHLAYWNPHNECGTGAVVPWNDKLWLITYGPHYPNGSKDKLYSVTKALDISSFAGSVGGTPANRMIHRETNQLVIGPYIIDQQENVRVIPPSAMPGRLTGNARHLFHPESKIYYATMEEGFYEVDLKTFEVTELFADMPKQAYGGKPNPNQSGKPAAGLPGYHGKGLYSGQGRLIYANNGEGSPEARRRPDVPSGCLAEWDGKSDSWTVIRRNQFTDVRGPGGIYGNSNPATDPIWAIGWDHRSLLLMLLDNGQWHTYRLPKASHCYDGAHGWNTEWPRFQDIGEVELVMNMHGMFWTFPRTFSLKNSAGISPRSTYLKVLGDYCRWGDQLVFGCDDTAKSEFLNKRRAKGKLNAPGQSHSNLWFESPDVLDRLGPVLGRGAVWVDDQITADTPSDPFLMSGFQRRALHLVNHGDADVEFTLELDSDGTNQWSVARTVDVPAGDARWLAFDKQDQAQWLRIRSNKDTKASAQFHFSNPDNRGENVAPIFDGLAQVDAANVTGGLVRVRGENLRTMAFVSWSSENGETSDKRFYELDENMQLKRIDDDNALEWTAKNTSVPEDILEIGTASVAYVDDHGDRWRLPKGDAGFDRTGPLGLSRIDREVATERDLFNCHGTFYELPARNAGGFSKIRPVASHRLRLKDYCSYRGLLILTGIDLKRLGDNKNPHIVRSDDGEAAVWAGVIEDLWKLGKPVGTGGPWYKQSVIAGEPSDPYLMTGYDRKSLVIRNDSDKKVQVTAQVDITGAGLWVDYQPFAIDAQGKVEHTFEDDFAAYWIRFVSDQDAKITTMLTYE